MSRYGFQNSGANAGNAIAEFLAQREMQNRQRMIDELAQAQQAENNQIRQREIGLRETQQQQQQAGLDEERGFRRATTLSQQALPGDPVDAATRDLMTQHGYGGQVQTTPGILQQGPELESADANPEGIPTYGVTQTPEQSVMRGGSQYMSARAAEDARRAQATEANTARVDAAEQARLGREESAGAQRTWQEGQNELNRTNQRDLRTMGSGLGDELKRIQIQTAQDKLDSGRAATDKTAGEAKASTESALAIAKRLKTHPGIGAATGAYEMRGFTQDAQNFNGIRNQLVNALALPSLGALKGPMSDKDVIFVKQLATRLENTKLDAAETQLAIDEAITFLESKLSAGPAAAPAPGGAGSSFRVVGQR